MRLHVDGSKNVALCRCIRLTSALCLQLALNNKHQQFINIPHNQQITKNTPERKRSVTVGWQKEALNVGNVFYFYMQLLIAVCGSLSPRVGQNIRCRTIYKGGKRPTKYKILQSLLEMICAWSINVSTVCQWIRRHPWIQVWASLYQQNSTISFISFCW